MASQNEEESEYVVQDFGTIMQEICYAYESQYPPSLHYKDGVGYFTVYKLTICSEGWIEYKGQYTDFDVKLWPRIELLAKVMTNDSSINLFYLNEK